MWPKDRRRRDWTNEQSSPRRVSACSVYLIKLSLPALIGAVLQ